MKNRVGISAVISLKSSMTLSVLEKPKHEVFQKVLDKFFRGEKDQKKHRNFAEYRKL
ncbi:DUF1810 family protein [Faecalicatena contorta]|uniref:DUF1810 family protein n=1 Tax=Faecalicatena contorta TaxID=39482 RepID=UPI003B507D8A